jgi:hypothetical protein
VTTLSFGSNVAAVELSVEAYRRMWQLKIGSNDALAKFYPGLHLTEASIRSAFERGFWVPELTRVMWRHAQAIGRQPARDTA